MLHLYNILNWSHLSVHQQTTNSM